ncbi:MAG: hypothetical protein IKM55_04550 [Bacilli bacterium]|nr:hypothetical protein [Bacillota bacterium]MBR6821475.1 hypothetical protein [Bacilli bacterium]
MMYLKDLGFEEDVINSLLEELPSGAVEKITEHEETITANINYLKDLGISNYVEAFVRFYNMFLLEPSSFDEIFSKYDKDDLIVKLEKNVAIMEYL